MYWLFFLLACGAFLVAFTTPQVWLLVLALLASLGFFIAWAYGFYSARVSARRQDPTTLINPTELQRLRAIAETKKKAEGTPMIDSLDNASAGVQDAGPGSEPPLR